MALNQTIDQQAHLLETALSTPEGRMHIAARLIEPIKQERDYVSFGRQGFVLDELAQGDVPYYDCDVKIPAVVLPKRGEVPQIRVGVNRVEVPIFPIAAYPLIPIEDTKLRRFNVIDRVQTKTRADLAEEEDRLIFGDMSTTPPSGYPQPPTQTQNQGARGGMSVFQAATDATTYDGKDAFEHTVNTVVASTQGVTKELLSAGYGQILQHDLIPEAFIMNPTDYVDFYTWGRDEFDPETQREVRETGRMGKLWDCEIHMSKICPPGTIWCRTSDYHLGVIPILIDLEVMDAPDPRGLNYGFCFYEFLGLLLANSWGVSKMTVTR